MPTKLNCVYDTYYIFFKNINSHVWYIKAEEDKNQKRRKKREHVKFVSLFTVIVKKDGFKVSFGPVLQHSLNPSVTLLNWAKVYNAVCTPMPGWCTSTLQAK